MKLIVLLCGLVLAGCGSEPWTPIPDPVAPHSVSNKPPTTPPPPPKAEEVTVRAGFIWISGHWTYYDEKWDWQAGHWERERAGMIWRDGGWTREGDHYVWVPGEWTVVKKK